MLGKHIKFVPYIQNLFQIQYSFSTQGLFSKQKHQVPALKTDSVREFNHLLSKLKEKKVDSSFFQEIAMKNLEELTKESTSKVTGDDRRSEYKIQDYFMTLATSIRYLKHQSVTEILGIFIKYENISQLKVEIIDEIIVSLTDMIFRGQFSKIEYELIYSEIQKLLQKVKISKSVKVLADIIRNIDYHEQFDQKDIEIFSRYFSDENIKHKSISAHMFSIKKLINFLRTAMKKNPSMKIVQIASESKIFLEEIFDYCTAYVNKDYIPTQDYFGNFPLVYLVNCSSLKNNPEFWLSFSNMIESDPNVPLGTKIEFLYKSYQVSNPNKSKSKKNSQKFLNPTSELESQIKSVLKNADMSKVTLFDISSIINLLTRTPYLTPGSKSAITSFLTNKINLEPTLVSKLEFIDIILLLSFLQTYRVNSLVNVILLQAGKILEQNITNFSELLYTLTILLNFRIIPRELIQLLPKYDSKDRRKFDSIQSIYYISTYCNLFELTHQYNNISHPGLQHIEDILYNNHKQMSIDEKCIIFMKMKYISSLNKSLYIAKSLISDLKSIPQKFFAATVNNLYNYSYLQLDHKAIFEEIQIRLPQFTHKDLVYIGKGLMWHNQGTDKFWREFFTKLDNMFKKQFLDYTTWICDLYQVIYTLQLKNPELWKEIELKCEDIDFEQVKRLYFERPSMPTSEEITKSEFEIEDILMNLQVKYERQKIIGIHKPDFIINDKIVLEIYGRHHFAEKNIINGSTLWRENQLKAIGLEIRAINLQEWNSLGTAEKRVSHVKKLLSL